MINLPVSGTKVTKTELVPPDFNWVWTIQLSEPIAKMTGTRVGMAVGVGGDVGVGDAVGLGVFVGIGVFVGVFVGIGVEVAVGVGAFVGVAVGVFVDVGVGVGDGTLHPAESSASSNRMIRQYCR
jgi:hypothetical protein